MQVVLANIAFCNIHWLIKTEIVKSAYKHDIGGFQIFEFTAFFKAVSVQGDLTQRSMSCW